MLPLKWMLKTKIYFYRNKLLRDKRWPVDSTWVVHLVQSLVKDGASTVDNLLVCCMKLELDRQQFP